MKKLTAIIDKKSCVACGVCVKACPRKAIKIFKGCYGVVDKSKCAGCGICQKNCPASLIRMEA